MLLYKYANIDRLGCVANRSVRFTPVAEFNDPFEAPIPQNENDAERARFGLVDRIVASFLGIAKGVEKATQEAKSKANEESGRYLVKVIETYHNDLPTDEQDFLRGSSHWKPLLYLARQADLDNLNWAEDFARHLLALDSQLKTVTSSGMQPLFKIITSTLPPYLRVDDVSVSLDGDQLKHWVAKQEPTSDFSYLKTADLNRLANHLGVLSLTTDPFSLLMWAHYGAEHTGVVIGFDMDVDCPSAAFGRNESDVTTAIDLRPVRYGTHRPIRHLDTYNAIDFIFTKSIDWRYEYEWRAVALLSSADDVVDTEFAPVHLFRVESNVIRRIIFGARVDNTSIVESFKSLGLGQDALEDIVVERMQSDPLEFKLNSQPVELTKLTQDARLPGDKSPTVGRT